MEMHAMTFAELSEYYLRNVRMRNAEECQNLIDAINSLRLTRPIESDKSGERFTIQTLDKTHDLAEKKLAMFRLCNRPTQVIVPPDGNY